VEAIQRNTRPGALRLLGGAVVLAATARTAYLPATLSSGAIGRPRCCRRDAALEPFPPRVPPPAAFDSGWRVGCPGHSRQLNVRGSRAREF